MAAPFAIDPATGRIRFPDLSIELQPGMAEQEFITASSSLNRENLGFHKGWQRYSVRAPISDDRRIGLYLIFFQDRLTRASFAYCPKDETWDNWTEEAERARLKEYQQELEVQLGGRRTFPWGKASVLLDSKSGGTDIWIDYSGQP